MGKSDCAPPVRFGSLQWPGVRFHVVQLLLDWLQSDARGHQTRMMVVSFETVLHAGLWTGVEHVLFIVVEVLGLWHLGWIAGSKMGVGGRWSPLISASDGISWRWIGRALLHCMTWYMRFRLHHSIEWFEPGQFNLGIKSRSASILHVSRLRFFAYSAIDFLVDEDASV